MALLSRDQILGSNDLEREEVPVPEWGGEVLVRVMPGVLRDRFEGAFVNARYINIRAKLAAFSICDDKGKLLFTETDIVALGDKSSAALDRVFEVAQRINQLSGEDIKELGKNSETSPSDDSPYDSQHILG